MEVQLRAFDGQMGNIAAMGECLWNTYFEVNVVKFVKLEELIASFNSFEY